MLLAVLQLPEDVVEHEQLAPAVLQQLHLVTNLKHIQSSTTDTIAPEHGNAGSRGCVCISLFLVARLPLHHPPGFLALHSRVSSL